MSPVQGECRAAIACQFQFRLIYLTPHSIRPSSTIPICLDLGTNNQKFLDDPLYLGLRRRRVSDEEMSEFMEEFMHEMSVVFPDLLIQFEDFATDKVSMLITFLIALRCSRIL